MKKHLQRTGKHGLPFACENSEEEQQSKCEESGKWECKATQRFKDVQIAMVVGEQ